VRSRRSPYQVAVCEVCPVGTVDGPGRSAAAGESNRLRKSLTGRIRMKQAAD
jgi:hypothetical protein